MPDDDLDYYRRRADIELDQAQAATVPKVAAVHHRLADAYLERIEAARGPGRPVHD